MTASDIISRVASARSTTVSRLRSPNRCKSMARIRHEVMWLLREATEISFPEIARFLGRSDHTTAISGVRKIQASVALDPEYERELLALASPRHTEMVTFAKREVAALRAKLAEREERLRELLGEDTARVA